MSKKEKKESVEKKDYKALQWGIGQLSQEASKLAEEILALEGDITEIEDMVNDFVVRFDGESKALLNDLASLMFTFKGIGNAQQANAERNMALAQSNLKKAKTIHETLEQFMLTHNLKRVETDEYTLNIQRASQGKWKFIDGFYDSEGNFMGQLLPPELQKIEYKQDTKKINELLKNVTPDIDGKKTLIFDGKIIGMLMKPSLYLRVF